MNIPRILSSVAVLAFSAGFWTACSIGFDVDGTEHQFSCTTDQDCLGSFRCNGGVCVPRSGSPGGNCVDMDEDGFGVGETGDCAKCREEGRCEEDCNDSDPLINPGLLDTCDGKDNNCNDEIDEVLTCEQDFDCPEEQPYFAVCETGSCVYRPPLQTTAACRMPVACADGDRVYPGDECF